MIKESKTIKSRNHLKCNSNRKKSNIKSNSILKLNKSNNSNNKENKNYVNKKSEDCNNNVQLINNNNSKKITKGYYTKYQNLKKEKELQNNNSNDLKNTSNKKRCFLSTKSKSKNKTNYNNDNNLESVFGNEDSFLSSENKLDCSTSSLTNNSNNYTGNACISYIKDSIEMSKFKARLVCCINEGIPINVYGLSGTGKSEFLNSMIEEYIELSNNRYKNISKNDIHDNIANNKNKNYYEDNLVSLFNFDNLRYNYFNHIDLDSSIVLIDFYDLLNSNNVFELIHEQIINVHSYKFYLMKSLMKLNFKEEELYTVYNDYTSVPQQKQYYKDNIKVLFERLSFLEINCITFIVDNINNISYFNDKIFEFNLFLELIKSFNQGIVLVSSFPINCSYNLNLLNSTFSLIKFPYIIPRKILEKEVFEVIRYSQEAESYEEESQIIKSIKSYQEDNNFLTNNKLINSKYILNKNKNASNKNLRKNTINTQKSISNKSTNNYNKSTKSIRSSSSVNPKLNLKKLQLEKNDKVTIFKELAINDLRQYMFNYNEFIHFFKYYTELFINFDNKGYKYHLRLFLQGSCFHFSQEKSDKKSDYEVKFDIYSDLVENNQSEIINNLGLSQKLFLISCFICSRIENLSELSIFEKSICTEKQNNSNIDNEYSNKHSSKLKSKQKKQKIIINNQKSISFKTVLAVYNVISRNYIDSLKNTYDVNSKEFSTFFKVDNHVEMVSNVRY